MKIDFHLLLGDSGPFSDFGSAAMPSSKEVLTDCNTIGDRGGCLSKGVRECLFRLPVDEDDLLADDTDLLDNLMVWKRVGRNRLSGVFSRGGDQVVEVPIDDGVSCEMELSKPNTASGVGRIA